MENKIEKIIRETLVMENKNSVKYAVRKILLLFDVKQMLFDWQIYVNELNGDKHGIPDNVEIDKFLSNYFA